MKENKLYGLIKINLGVATRRLYSPSPVCFGSNILFTSTLPAFCEGPGSYCRAPAQCDFCPRAIAGPHCSLLAGSQGSDPSPGRAHTPLTPPHTPTQPLPPPRTSLLNLVWQEISGDPGGMIGPPVFPKCAAMWNYKFTSL